jgi:hypothetical protein
VAAILASDVQALSYRKKPIEHRFPGVHEGCARSETFVPPLSLYHICARILTFVRGIGVLGFNANAHLHFVHFVTGHTAASALWIDVQPGVAARAIHAGRLSRGRTEWAVALGTNEAIEHVGYWIQFSIGCWIQFSIALGVT